eukprot:CCRYP_015144-RA/>CCRYP_015144-RA protein AED:0.27 eAED:0.27 QI:1560/1/1/1/0/0/3/25/62
MYFRFLHSFIETRSSEDNSSPRKCLYLKIPQAFYLGPDESLDLATLMHYIWDAILQHGRIDH